MGSPSCAWLQGWNVSVKPNYIKENELCNTSFLCCGLCSVLYGWCYRFGQDVKAEDIRQQETMPIPITRIRTAEEQKKLKTKLFIPFLTSKVHTSLLGRQDIKGGILIGCNLATADILWRNNWADVETSCVALPCEEFHGGILDEADQSAIVVYSVDKASSSTKTLPERWIVGWRHTCVVLLNLLITERMSTPWSTLTVVRFVN